VPTQPRLGFDEEARPAGSGQDAADGREQGPVGRLKPGSRRLVAPDDELVAQNEELEIFGGVATGELGEQLNSAAERQVGELRQHRDLCGWGDGSATVASRAVSETCSSQA
jgi:hypothetical protein